MITYAKQEWGGVIGSLEIDGENVIEHGMLPTHDEIARRAFEIYLRRGGGDDGHSEEDWLEAERELIEEMHESAGPVLSVSEQAL